MKHPKEHHLIDWREVNEMIGSRCKNASTARRLAKAGRITAVKIGTRTIRYTRSSVEALTKFVSSTQ